MASHACELCDGDGGELIVRREKWRIVRVTGDDGTAYPGFCRVVWNAHVKELTDLSETDRQIFMAAVFTLEAALRQALQPVKMNVASLGNLTPHLHWHVIPRFHDDPAFPKPVWAISTPPASSLDTLAGKQASARGDADQAWLPAVTRAFATI
jgi:diadenosine tetraphosphate (Ap4A) HIT family hydrolase